MLRAKAILTPSVIEKACENIIRRYSTGERHLGFSFYPRFPDQKESPITPSKLLMVQIIKTMRGKPWWDRKRLCQLGLNPEVDHRAVTVVKNTPEMCATLWKVKHLVRITPITFPNGEPTEKDIGATYLNSQGQLLVSEKYRVDPAAVKAEEDFYKKVTYLDWKTKKRDSIKKWNHGFDLD